MILHQFTLQINTDLTISTQIGTSLPQFTVSCLAYIVMIISVHPMVINTSLGGQFTSKEVSRMGYCLSSMRDMVCARSKRKFWLTACVKIAQQVHLREHFRFMDKDSQFLEVKLPVSPPELCTSAVLFPQRICHTPQQTTYHLKVDMNCKFINY